MNRAFSKGWQRGDYDAIGNVMNLTKSDYDAIGNVMNLTNAQCQVQSSYTYDAFGNILSGTSAYNDINFQTKPWEGNDTGLYYSRTRYYDPAVGRFVSRDPIGYTGGVNPYVYVYNNPLNRLDSSGLVDEGDTCECEGEIAYGSKMETLDCWKSISQSAAATGTLVSDVEFWFMTARRFYRIWPVTIPVLTVMHVRRQLWFYVHPKLGNGATYERENALKFECIFRPDGLRWTTIDTIVGDWNLIRLKPMPFLDFYTREILLVNNQVRSDLILNPGTTQPFSLMCSTWGLN